ncbi:MAG: glucosaminidase domain-containing protein [Patescibacteria group bacterium]|nr:glucosaminidase domain-containing protein [Patescibacteria group bacterium]
MPKDEWGNEIPKNPTPIPTQAPTKQLGLVDYLKSIGHQSTFENRSMLAKQHGISNYVGSAQQNIQLLKELQSGKKPSRNTDAQSYQKSLAQHFDAYGQPMDIADIRAQKEAHDAMLKAGSPQEQSVKKNINDSQNQQPQSQEKPQENQDQKNQNASTDVNPKQGDSSSIVPSKTKSGDPLTDEQISQITKTLDSINSMMQKMGNPLDDPHLADVYNQMRQQMGLPALEGDINTINSALFQAPDMIRSDLTNSGATVTNAQVDFLVNKRNNVLFDRLNSLQSIYQMKQKYVDDMVSLTGQDHQIAAQNFETAFNMQQQLESTMQKLYQYGSDKNMNAIQFAMQYRISKPYYKVGNRIYNTSTGQAFDSQQAYIDNGGKGDFSDVQDMTNYSDPSQFITSYSTDAFGNRTPMLYDTYSQKWISPTSNSMPTPSSGSSTSSTPFVPQGSQVSENPIWVDGSDLSNYPGTNVSQDQKQAYADSIEKIIGSMPQNLSNKGALDAYLSQNYPNSPITSDMILQSAAKNNIDPRLITAVMAHETGLLTNPESKTAKDTNNPGAVGQWTGHSTKYKDLSAGVDAVGMWLGNHRQGDSNQDPGISLDPQQMQQWLSYTPTVREMAKKVAKYDFGTYNSLPAKAKSAVSAAASLINPSLDVSAMSGMKDFMKNWQIPTSRGNNLATARGAIQRAVDHLVTFKNTFDQLKNTQYRYENKYGQDWKKNFEKDGNPGLNAFITARNFVSDELTKYLIGGVPGTTEIENTVKSFDYSSTPEEFKSAMDTINKLSIGALTPMATQYVDTMKRTTSDYTDPHGIPPQGDPLLTQQNIQSLKSLGMYDQWDNLLKQAENLPYDASKIQETSSSTDYGQYSGLVNEVENQNTTNQGAVHQSIGDWIKGIFSGIVTP